MQCPNCGAFMTNEDAFCGECGQPLQKQASPARPLTPLEAKDLPTVELGTKPPSPPVPPKPRTTAGGTKSPLPVVLLVAGIALLVVCLCGAGLLIWMSSKDGPVATPTDAVLLATATDSDPAVKGTIYEENFDDATSGWDVWEDDDTWADYVDGGYRVSILRQDYVAWGTCSPALELADFVVEVDARQVEGPLDNNFGVLVRYQADGESFYWFEISGDGYYSVDLLQAGEWTTLVSWEMSDAIQQGVGNTNRLKVVCAGDRFSFFVNDTHLTDVTDATFATGSIGLAAGTFDEEGVVIQFDNMKVYSPQK